MADHSMLGEEDPGAAMDLIYGALMPVAPPPVFSPPGLAIPEDPSAAVAEARLADVAAPTPDCFDECDVVPSPGPRCGPRGR